MRRLALLALALGACTDGPGDRAVPADPEASPATFAVRGRLDDPGNVSWRLDGTSGPLPEEALVRAVEAAHAAWEAAAPPGRVAFRPARADEVADVTYGWRTGAHDACRPFGRGVELAHTGPMGGATFVHLDAERGWTEGQDGEASLPLAVLHETGHVLGLDHTTDAGAIMAPGYETTARAPGRSDRAGLASLYAPDDPGGGLVIRSGDATSCVLVGVLLADRTGWTVANVDGDARDEVLVWRRDAAGLGALQVFRFEPRDGAPVLARTDGPYRGAVQPGARVFVGRDEAGRLLAVSVFDGGRLRVVELGRDGAPALVRPGQRFRLAAGVADEDGDGVADGAPPPRVDVSSLPADLDGDGRPEVVEARAVADD